MVESEAYELSEDDDARRRDVRSRGVPAGDPGIIELAELGRARTPWDVPEPSPRSPWPQQAARTVAARTWASPTDAQQAAPERGRPDEGRGGPPARRHEGRARVRCRRLQGARGEIVRGTSSTTARGSTAATPDRPPDRRREVGVLPRPTARPCSPAARRRPWWSPRSAPARTSRSSTPSRANTARHFMLHYNFPPYSVGEAGRMGWPRPARDRPRQAGLAGARSRCCRPGRVPLHHPRRLGDHRVQRLLLDGHGLRRLAGADGRGRAADAAGRRHRHGPDQGGRALCGPLRHPGRRGPPRRHGLQGRRHRDGGHRAADGHQDHLDHRGDHDGRARPGQEGPDCTSSGRCRRP